MGHTTTYKKGQSLFVCDRCGLTFHSEQKRKTWDGLIVDERCWEPRHPQDFVRGKTDDQTVDDARPEQGRKFLEEGDVTPESLSESVVPEEKPSIRFLEIGEVTADSL